jgi:AcrR family transcriptional regulator
MAKKNQAKTVETSISTEERIKQAAVKVFQLKGYSATRTRDIAEEAGINLALLNYYFRSKERLFEEVMLESMGGFMQVMTMVINEESTTLEQKINAIVSAYHDLLFDRPELPIFILSELRNGNNGVVLKTTGLKKIYQQSHFAKQYQEAVEKGKFANRPLIWLVMNMMSMTIFPFMAAPMLQIVGDMDQKQYDKMLKSRKESIVKWVIKTLKT